MSFATSPALTPKSKITQSHTIHDSSSHVTGGVRSGAYENGQNLAKTKPLNRSQLNWAQMNKLSHSA